MNSKAVQNLFILTTCQALGLAAPPMMVLVGGIIGTELAPSVSLSTLPLAMMIVGMAFFSVPAALLMGKVGRRLGFIAGILLALCSSLAAIYAITISSFTLFCLAAIGLGGNTAFVQQYRFAAAECVDKPYVGRAISLVLVGGVVAAILGPELGKHSKDWLSYGPYSGSFAALAVLYIIALVVMSFLQIKTKEHKHSEENCRPIRQILIQPLFMSAVFAGVVAYGCMSFIMTATPVSMHVIDGHSLGDTAWVIQSHVLAMFLPSFVTGALIDRFGLVKVMTAGNLLMALCALIAAYDQQLMHYWASLVLLGIGWNFLFVGATTLLTKTYQPNERFKSQAVNDFIIYGFQAMASLTAGAIIFHAGWKMVNLSTLPIILIMFVVVFRTRNHVGSS